VPELGSLGSVRGAPSNERPYREHIGSRHIGDAGKRAERHIVEGGRGPHNGSLARAPRLLSRSRAHAGGLSGSKAGDHGTPSGRWRIVLISGSFS
jgi:hypothetical protein